MYATATQFVAQFASTSGGFIEGGFAFLVFVIGVLFALSAIGIIISLMWAGFKYAFRRK